MPSATTGRATEFEFQREIRKIGQPGRPFRMGNDSAHRERPTTTLPRTTSISRPASLQPPFYDVHADDAVNFGGIGAVIGTS